MKEIINNQEGETMTINQQEDMVVNSTVEYMNPYVVEDKKREYTVVESVFAWMSFVFGYFFCKAAPAHVNSLGAFLLVLFAFIATTVVLKVKKVKTGLMPTVAAVSAVVVSATLVLSSNGMLQSLANTYAMVTYCYYIYAANGNSTKAGFNDFIVVDYHKALFVAPFVKLGSMVQGMFAGRNRKSGDVLGKLLKGGFIALIPTFLVCGLLSYDRDFYRIIENMGSFIDLDAVNVMGNIWSLGIGIIVGQYVFRLFLTSSAGAVKDTSEEECVTKLRGMQKAHVVTTLAAVLPIIFIYVVFFISQWKYYVSAFSGKLPSGISYADYAREGFFQLCMVSFINMIIIVFVQLFMNVEKTVIAKIKSSIVITYAVCTLVLIATAMSKMALYIDSYGLTQKRLYSSWLMIVLAVIFVVVVVKQFMKNLQAVAVSFAVVVVMFSGLALSNVDGLIARYNVDRYLEGSLETVDVWAMEDLGDAAVPELVRLLEELEARGAVGTDSYSGSIYDKTDNVLKNIAIEYHNENRQVMSYTIPYINALDALEDAGLKDWFYEW